MFKEIVISIVIIVSIISLDFVTQNYTNETISNTNLNLNNLKEKINENKSKLEDKTNEDLNYYFEKIKTSWTEKRKTLAYYIEHDELEKVDTDLTNLKSYLDVNDLEMAIYSIDEAKYILEHIKQKNSFSLVNVF